MGSMALSKTKKSHLILPFCLPLQCIAEGRTKSEGVRWKGEWGVCKATGADVCNAKKTCQFPQIISIPICWDLLFHFTITTERQLKRWGQKGARVVFLPNAASVGSMASSLARVPPRMKHSQRMANVCVCVLHAVYALSVVRVFGNSGKNITFDLANGRRRPI